MRGEEERGRVGMKRNMERREEGLDGGEMETSGWTWWEKGVHERKVGVMEKPGRDIGEGKTGRQREEREREGREKKVIHKHFLKIQFSPSC